LPIDGDIIVEVLGTYRGDLMPYLGHFNSFSWAVTEPTDCSVTLTLKDASLNAISGFSNLASTASPIDISGVTQSFYPEFELSSESSGVSPTLNSYTVDYNANISIVVGGVFMRGLMDFTLNKNFTTTSSTFSVTFANPQGIYNNQFEINDNVTVYIKSVDYPDGVQVFRGFVSAVDSKQYARIVLTGFDYAEKLKNYVVSDTWNNRELSTVITDSSVGLKTYCTELGFTWNSIATTSITLDQYQSKQRTIYNIMADIADMAQFDFWVDYSLDVHFAARASVDSGKTLDTATNINSYDFNSDLKDSINKITIYGGDNTYFTEDLKTGDGTTKSFDLTYEADSPMITVTVDAVAKVEGTDFTVDYAGKTINFTTAPASSKAVVIDYNYTKQTLATRSNAAAISAYNTKEKYVNDRSARSNQRCAEIADAYMALYSDPRKLFKVRMRADVGADLTLGNIVVVNIPKADIVSTQYVVAQQDFKIGTQGYWCDLTLASADLGILEVLRAMEKDMEELKSRDVTNTNYLANNIPETLALAEAWSSKYRLVGDALIWGVSLWGSKWGLGTGDASWT
jgi:hypothetical protein